MVTVWCVTATSGPVKGCTWSVGHEALVVGRSRQCRVFIPDGSVSRLHCEFTVLDKRLTLKDLGSSNATLVNGRPVQEAKLRPGDEVAVGPSVFLVTRFEGDPSTTPSANDGIRDDRTTTFAMAGRGRADTGVIMSDTVEARPRTVHDLAQLYDIGRELVNAPTVSALVEILRKRVRDRFGAVSMWLVRCHGAEDDLVVMSEEKDAQAQTPLAAMVRAMQEKRPMLMDAHAPAAREAGQALYVAPILCGGTKVGAIALLGKSATTTEAESDLMYLMALAYEAAPHFLSTERLEQLNRDIERLRARAGESTSLIGQSEAIRNVREALQEAAQSNLNVLLLGETGTGKELAARLIHDSSRRALGPYVVVNCAAIPATLFESEMFGHERGAFTGADRANIGRVQQAHGGTLFLDEIGELSPESQARILRLVENGTFHRVGSTKETKVDIRVVAATNREIPSLVRLGKFREDLYHRINGFEVRMPALRDRPTDIPILATHFVEQIREEAKRPVRGLDAEAMAYLRERPWPGNVRELRRCIERAVALARSDVIGVEDLLVYGSPPTEGTAATSVRRLADIERDYIVDALRACHGKVTDAAQALGIGRSTLYNKIAEYEIDVE